VLESEGILTQACNSPVAPLNLSISWSSLVVPSEAVNKISYPSSRASAAKSVSELKLIKTGKLV